MTIYEELQLNQIGSKNLIKQSKDKKEKIRHILIYILKVLITLLFCITFVTIFTTIFGSENGITGVVVLLFLLVFRQSDFNIKASHSIINMFIIFTILAISPYIASISSPAISLLINFISILLLVILSCHNVNLFNHSTVILCYLLLFGYEAEGKIYIMRILGLMFGAILCSIIIYRHTIKKQYEKGIKNFFSEFDIKIDRSKWQISLAFAISSAIFFAQLFNFQRVMWVGFSVLSISQISPELRTKRAIARIPGTFLGVALFYILYKIVPNQYHSMFGLLGGLLVGFSATYSMQTTFNCLGALYSAIDILEIKGVIIFRIINTIFGVLYGLLFHFIFDKIHLKYTNKKV